MALNLIYVPYNGDNQGAQISRQIRRQQNNINAQVGGRNLAVLCFTASWLEGEQVIVGSSLPNEHKHSEVVAIEGLSQALDANNKYAVINWLYTERAPCGIGPGMANCTQYLDSFFNSYRTCKKLGVGAARVEDRTPVFYSFQYPSGGRQEINESLDILNAAGITDEPNCITLREYLLVLGKEDRKHVTGILKKEGR
jgi:hypothetical protein